MRHWSTERVSAILATLALQAIQGSVPSVLLDRFARIRTLLRHVSAMPLALLVPSWPPIAACALLAMLPMPRFRVVRVCLDTPARLGWRRPSARLERLLPRMLPPASSVRPTPMHRSTGPRRVRTARITPQPQTSARPRFSSAIATPPTTATISTLVWRVRPGIGVRPTSVRRVRLSAITWPLRLHAPYALLEVFKPPPALLFAAPVRPAPPSFTPWSARI